jgi:hypothetical protein
MINSYKIQISTKDPRIYLEYHKIIVFDLLQIKRRQKVKLGRL